MANAPAVGWHGVGKGAPRLPVTLSMTVASLPLRLLLLVVAALAVGIVGMQMHADAPLAGRLTSRAAEAFGMGGPDPTRSVNAAPSVSVAPGGVTGRISEADPLH